MSRFSEQALKLWISQDFYIPIDEQGYCLGKYYEGAMGIVVEIKRVSGGSYALKIPWLMGDTVKENAYVCELLAEERKSVLSVFSDCQNTRGLMHAEVFGSSVIQKPIQTISAHPEAQLFHNASIAIQFNKGKAPRFCAIYPSEEKAESLYLFPESIEDCPFADQLLFEQAYELSQAEQTDWSNVVGANISAHETLTGITTLKESLHIQTEVSPWFLGVPAVVYVWGSSTLHEALSEGKLADWSLEHHIVLLETLVAGLSSLHKRGYLHTDIRPANIMSRGDSSSPDNFYLIDYAGYNIGKPGGKRIYNRKNGPTHQNLLGPSIGGERQSPFYAPERAKGIEKEGADIAIVLDREDHYLIAFGWRSKLLENSGNDLDEPYLEELSRYIFDDALSWGERIRQPEQINNENDILLPGDRLQIRDFVFRIEAVGMLKGIMEGIEVYKCSKHYYKLFHNRIVVSTSEPFSKPWITIPRVIELRQWAAGIDVFGIGALFLYTLFRMRGDTYPEMKIAQDQKFERLLEELSNPHYLDTIWYELSRICTQLSICHSQLRPKDDLDKILFKADEFWDQSQSVVYNEGKSITEYARFVTTLILHTAPDSIRILQNLNHNYIYFLFVVYFTLCCLHRQKAMTPRLLFNDNNIPTDKNNLAKLYHPFCFSRTTPPNTGQEESPIESAQHFVQKLKKLAESGYYDDYILENQDELKPANAPAPLLRREISQLKTANNDLTDHNQSLSNEIEKLKKQKRELENQFDDYQQKLHSIYLFAEGLNKKIFYKNSQIDNLISEISHLKAIYKN